MLSQDSVRRLSLEGPTPNIDQNHNGNDQNLRSHVQKHERKRISGMKFCSQFYCYTTVHDKNHTDKCIM